ncbi:MAG: flagellar basal body P-ring protein FlgI [Buchnera aphidicola (Brevicoryne brassicae)]|uniref:Flagellar P-ring protein n=1 Tax=Buchnera aphidicola (Brevicoryne brassicae) TaxID=911343 RepID=A0AAJ5PUH6_9GAMM|nr:flagellar basal body P-ring protein FlgI [Buchnera aphidicola]QCI19904.1 flagellar basal body P-ring protein FlgI [Buchnera aphidicola (Brevicoryne brassicae)]WAI18727.1 MAG: flagellar basal body P-ring protein FlgI [Buchnera aphidicola (Brevicoryne brassicae)]
MSKTISLLKFIIFIFISLPFSTYAEKIRDLTSIQGIRDNQLIGYGLIVGLDGTGDQSTQAPFTNQSLNNMLSQLGVAIPPDINMHLKNVAAVIVTANLPPFSHTGEKIDVKVSSMGNSKSLKGGTLLMTPLKGTDNQIYAIAQGAVLISEKDHSQKKIHYIRSNQVNSGIINHGATIEREVKTNFGQNNTINLQLNQEDFSTAQRISDMINIKYPDTATPINSKTVQLSTSANNDVQVHMLSNIQDIDISLPSQEAKIVVNPRTGSIVINQAVQLGSCVISSGNISIILNQTINKNKDFDFLKSLKKNEKKEQLSVELLNKNYMDRISSNKANLNNIVKSLNVLGTKPDELISILQLMKSAGCLNAKLEII